AARHFGPGAPVKKTKGKSAAPATAPSTNAATEKVWRFVTGAFQVKIPVATAKTILVPEENTLAIMKWRLEHMQKTNRWYPVLARYIEYIVGRVDGLGGNASKIPPSLNGAPVGIVRKHEPCHEQPEPCHETVRFAGRVVEIAYDCFGDFVGFVLSDCCKLHEFASRERGVGELILRAFEERLRLAVIVAEDRIVEVLIVE
ncbi:MAG: hypothetical protein ABSD44_07270, partial [Terracidiphilus sp.]